LFKILFPEVDFAKLISRKFSYNALILIVLSNHNGKNIELTGREAASGEGTPLRDIPQHPHCQDPPAEDR
jgi:hypothetical protein